MKVYEVPLALVKHYSDIKIKACCTKEIPRSSVTRLYAYNWLRYQVSVYRSICPLVCYCENKNYHVYKVIVVLHICNKILSIKQK